MTKKNTKSPLDISKTVGLEVNRKQNKSLFLISMGWEWVSWHCGSRESIVQPLMRMVINDHGALVEW